MFPHHICENIDIIAVMTARKNNFGFHSNRKTQGQKHQVNNLYFKYQVCQIKLRHLNTFLQFRLLFHEPHCKWDQIRNEIKQRMLKRVNLWALYPSRKKNFGFKSASVYNCGQQVSVISSKNREPTNQQTKLYLL